MCVCVCLLPQGRPPSASTSRSTTPGNDVIVIDDDSTSPSCNGDTEWNLASHLTEHGCSIKREQTTSGSPKELVDSTSAVAPDSSNAPGPSGVQPKTRSPTPNAPWYRDLITNDVEGNLELSGKLLFLMGLLEEAEQLKEKVLVFTQSLLTLDLIESVLNKPEHGEWTPGLDYYRLDGSLKADIRCSYMSDFNSEGNDRWAWQLIGVASVANYGFLVAYTCRIMSSMVIILPTSLQDAAVPDIHTCWLAGGESGCC